MAISAESISNRIILNISDTQDSFILQRAYYQNKTWLTYTESGFVEITEGSTESPVYVNSGDFIDSFDLSDGLYEYRYIQKDKDTSKGELWNYSTWVKYGNPECVGYTFGNYTAPEGSWGNAVCPDDLRYTYLWGTDFKATNGQYFNDTQIQWFIDQAVAYLERELNMTIKKRVIKSMARDRGFKKTTKFRQGDYDDEETMYDFAYRKIQRYGMITTRQRPIIDVTRCVRVDRDSKEVDLIPSMNLDRKRGIIKFMKRPFRLSSTQEGISTSIGMYGSQTLDAHLFYSIDYTAGFETSDELPDDLREIIAKVCAISLLNVIGDGLMSGFSSSSLSMDGISESFSSTQSATSAYYGARIQVYKDDVKNYIQDNKFKFGFIPIGAL